MFPKPITFQIFCVKKSKTNPTVSGVIFPEFELEPKLGPPLKADINVSRCLSSSKNIKFELSINSDIEFYFVFHFGKTTFVSKRPFDQNIGTIKFSKMLNKISKILLCFISIKNLWKTELQ